MEQVIYAGGTAGLIAFCLFVIYQFGGGKWHSHEEVLMERQRTTEANARTEAALAAGERATSSVEGLTEELAGYRTLVERLLAERGVKSGDT